MIVHRLLYATTIGFRNWYLANHLDVAGNVGNADESGEQIQIIVIGDQDQLIVRIVGQFIGPPFATYVDRDKRSVSRRDAIIIELMNQHVGSACASNSRGPGALDAVARPKLVYAAVVNHQNSVRSGVISDGCTRWLNADKPAR